MAKKVKSRLADDLRAGLDELRDFVADRLIKRFDRDFVGVDFVGIEVHARLHEWWVGESRPPM